MRVSSSLIALQLISNSIDMSQHCRFRYSGATGSRQSSQPRDTESLQQSNHRAAYISIANAEVEDSERRVSTLL